MKHRKREKYECYADSASLTILSFWVVVAVYFKNDITGFFIPPAYMFLQLMLLFQKIGMFFIKCVLFGPVYLVYCSCCCAGSVKNTKNSGVSASSKKDKEFVEIDSLRNLGMDPRRRHKESSKEGKDELRHEYNSRGFYPSMTSCIKMRICCYPVW